MTRRRPAPITRQALLASSEAHRASHGKDYDPEGCETCWRYEMALMGVYMRPIQERVARTARHASDGSR